MSDITKIFRELKKTLEDHSDDLKRGQVLLPEYLAGRRFTSAFRQIPQALATKLQLQVSEEVQNPFLPEYSIGNPQRVDFVFRETESEGRPAFFLEVESLDGAQLYHFLEQNEISEKDNYNKLWYYYGTLGNYYTKKEDLSVPPYFVWLLILPDRKIDLAPYRWWDDKPYYRFFHSSLKQLVCQNPYRFYDHLIKSAARVFIEDAEHRRFLTPGTKQWVSKTVGDCQKACELVFITCTIDELILSRGANRFDPIREVCKKLAWSGGGLNSAVLLSGEG